MVSPSLEEILSTMLGRDYLARWYTWDGEGLNLAPELRKMAQQLRDRQDACRGEATASAHLADVCAGYLVTRRGQTIISNNLHRTILLNREPLGLVGLITPSNVPLAGLMWKLLPALACGNDVIVKPAPDSISTKIAHWVWEEIIPDSLKKRVCILAGGSEQALKLCTHSAVKAISFTGSHQAGTEIATAAGTKKLSLEMGGHSVWIAFPSVHMGLGSPSVASAIDSAFSNGGTRCVSAKTFLLPPTLMGLAHALADRPDRIGPVSVLNREGELRDWMSRDPNPEEGVRIATYHTLEQLVRMANYSPYCLSAAVWTNDISKALWLTRRLNARTVHINGNTYGSEPQSPFGGEGWSGNGSREPGLEAFDFYSSTKQITMTERMCQ